jgi:hypothetical protein
LNVIFKLKLKVVLTIEHKITGFHLIVNGIEEIYPKTQKINIPLLRQNLDSL